MDSARGDHGPEHQTLRKWGFSYDLLPVNRQRAMASIRREVEAARRNGLNARLLVPLTRSQL